MTPAAVAEEVRDQLEFLTAVAGERGSLGELGIVCEELSAHYRALGICLLSGDADVDGFFHHLIQSALTRRHWLAGTRAAPDARQARASIVDPVLDAMAARQWGLCTEILELSAGTWTQGEEYEDDFCHADFLRRAVAGRSGLEEITDRWEKVLEGGKDTRLPLAHSLAAKDDAAFADALQHHLELREEAARCMADPVDGSLLAEDVTFLPNRWIAVEGLAWLALAEREGMAVPGLFHACPPLARARTFAPFRSCGWPHVAHANE